MICPICGKDKDSTRERPNGYAQDVNNEEDAQWTACDECNQQNNDDI